MKRSAELQAAHQFHYDYANPLADVKAVNLQVVQGAYSFDVLHKDFMVANVLLPMGGLHNIENAIAAITVAKYLGIEDEKICAAIANFKGVKRRFEYMIHQPNLVLIDDYAHHPEELRALISGVRSLFAAKKMVLVFQPHLFSRTNDLAKEFAESLDMADQVILLPIYPARELPMEGVSSYSILVCFYNLG
jgi:UDP-N-acetylmuramate--alanine ligase